MAEMSFGDLRVDVVQSPGTVRLDWRGKSNEREPERKLNPFLADVLSRAREGRAKVEMHFEELEFFNSATISVVISYGKQLRDQKVPLSLTYSFRSRWQRIFFDALTMFKRDDG